MMTPTISNLPAPTTSGPSADSSSTNEPVDLLGAEFAAMLASLCAAQQQAAPPVTPTEAMQEEVTETTIELTPEITLKSEDPAVLFKDPKAELPVEFEALPPDVLPGNVSDDVAVESEAQLQSAPTASLVYNPNTVTTKGTIVAPRETRISQASAPLLPKIETPVVQAESSTPAAESAPQILEVATDEIPLPAPSLEATISEETLETKSTITLPVVVVKGRPGAMINEAGQSEEYKKEIVDTVSEAVNVETNEPLSVKTQTKATQRISNLIATYLIEGVRNGSGRVITRFAGLEFELELDPAARQKRQTWKADNGRGSDLSLRPFSDLIANAVTQTKDASPVVQVSHRVVDLVKTSTREVESLNFRLNPKELGEVDLKLTRHKDGSISAHLTTEREVARMSLTRSVDELRQSLEQAGVQVAKLQVSSGATSMDNHRRHDHDSSANSAEFRTTTTTNSNEPEASSTSTASHDRLLSLRA